MKRHRQFPRRMPSLILTGSLLVMVLGFQNCGSFKASSNLNKDYLQFASSGGSDLQPSTDKVDADCMRQNQYDACIFKKNPVASRQQVFSQKANASTPLEDQQTFGVKLTGLATTGNLENDTLSIRTVTGNPVSTQTSSLKFSAQNDSDRRFLQVMTYYWLNRASEYLQSRTNALPARGKGIQIFVDDSIAGWSPKTNSIHLKLDDNGSAMAWNADLAIYFFGLANLHHATNGAFSNMDATAQGKHRDCNLKAAGCCTSQTGCSRAIASGIGDYFVAMIFPDQPIVGETWANRVDGLNHCSLNRNLNTASSNNASGVFQACGGDISSMGTIYASIWWSVRNQAQSTRSTGASDIDTLFMQHLSLLSASDDFSTVKSKIESVDQRLFNSRYTSLFRAQFQARGL